MNTYSVWLVFIAYMGTLIFIVYMVEKHLKYRDALQKKWNEGTPFLSVGELFEVVSVIDEDKKEKNVFHNVTELGFCQDGGVNLTFSGGSFSKIQIGQGHMLLAIGEKGDVVDGSAFSLELVRVFFGEKEIYRHELVVIDLSKLAHGVVTGQFDEGTPVVIFAGPGCLIRIG